MEEQTELSKKNTTDDIRARFLLAIDDTRLNGSQIGRRIRELGFKKDLQPKKRQKRSNVGKPHIVFKGVSPIQY